MSSGIIPVFTEYQTQRSKRDAWELASAVFTTLLTIVIGVTIVGILAASGIVWLLAPGFHEDPVRLGMTTLRTDWRHPRARRCRTQAPARTAATGAQRPALREKLYSSAATEVTHARLRETAALVLANGHSVIIDATFMALKQRELARALAGQLGVRFVIVDFQAQADTLRQRVQQRAQRVDDASEAGLAVLEDQLAHAQPLQPQELPAVFAFDAEPRYDEASMAARWSPLLQRLGWPVTRP